MERLMKRSTKIVLMAVLILSMMVISVNASAPQRRAQKPGDTERENEQTRLMKGHQVGWGRWVDWDWIEEMFDEEDFKNLPPGIAKKGIPLPPGLMKRIDRLPPGIQHRFMRGSEWQHRTPADHEPEGTRIRVEGPRILTIPESGSLFAEYEMIVRDQRGKGVDASTVSWSISIAPSQGSLQGIRIDSTKDLSMRLRIDEDAEPGKLVITAEKGGVKGTLTVEVVETANNTVFTETALKEALEDEDIDVIFLGAHIVLTDAIIIDRDVTIDGRAYRLQAGDRFEGWLVEVKREAKVALYNLLLEGAWRPNNTQPDFVGLVKVGEYAELTAEGNRLRNAPVGFALRVDGTAFDAEELEDLAALFTDNNQFRNISTRIAVYDIDDALLHQD